MSVEPAARYAKPLPQIEPEARPYWESLAQHTMKVQQCADCGRWFFPPQAHCTNCLSENVQWSAVSGHGKVYAACTFYHAFHPAYGPGDVPYNLSLVELDEGPRVWSNVVGCSPDEVTIGMPVVAVYDDVTEEITLARFRPA